MLYLLAFLPLYLGCMEKSEWDMMLVISHDEHRSDLEALLKSGFNPNQFVLNAHPLRFALLQNALANAALLLEEGAIYTPGMMSNETVEGQETFDYASNLLSGLRDNSTRPWPNDESRRANGIKLLERILAIMQQQVIAQADELLAQNDTDRLNKLLYVIALWNSHNQSVRYLVSKGISSERVVDGDDKSFLYCAIASSADDNALAMLEHATTSQQENCLRAAQGMLRNLRYSQQEWDKRSKVIKMLRQLDSQSDNT